MIFHHVLDHVFSTWSHVAILRALQHAAQGLSGREVARLAAMTHRACLNALTDLEELGIILRHRGGRDHVFTLNRNYILVADGIIPLLDLEQDFRNRLDRFLKTNLRRDVDSMILFGSVARREETAASDLDLCLLVSHTSRIPHVRQRVHDLANTVREQFNARLSPIIFTKATLLRDLKRGKSPMREIAMGGITITGTVLREARLAQRSAAKEHRSVKEQELSHGRRELLLRG
jgi:predicted nucleotidyltransferase